MIFINQIDENENQNEEVGEFEILIHDLENIVNFDDKKFSLLLSKTFL